MRLLISIPYYEPAWAYGGPPRLVSTIARQLAKQHDVTVLTTDVLDASHRTQPLEEVLGGVRVRRFPVMSNTLAWKTKIIIPRGFGAAAAHYVRNSDFIFLSDFRHWLNASLAPHLWRHHKPYSLAAYGQIEKPLDLKYPLKVGFDYLWGKKLVQQAARLIAQTQHEANDYITLGAHSKQIKIVPLFETKPTTAEWNQDGQFRTRYHIPPETKLILFVGRLNKLKGLDVLLESFVRARHNLPEQDIRLVIVGRDDGYQKTLNTLIHELELDEAVIQTGPLYGPDNAACYLDADVFVFTPTYYEETSLATVRALSFGLPVITTPQAELPWLDEYQAGYTVSAVPTKIANQLTELLSHDIVRSQLRINAQRLFRERYECEQAITRLNYDLEHIVQSVS